jgi:HK97 family phage major capsid protein
MEQRLGDLTREMREKHAGRLFGRWARCAALGRRKQVDPARIAEQMRFVEAATIATIGKAAVGAHTTSDTSLFYPISQDLAPIEAKFSAVRRMQAAFRQIPSNRNVITTTSGSAAFWQGEGAPVPMSALALGPRSALLPMRLSALSAITNELAETTNAEKIIAVDHGRAKGDELDRAFLDIENAGSPEVLPRSITHDARQFVSSGSTVALIDSDLRALVNELSHGGSNLLSAVFIARPETGAFLATLRGSGGSPSFPGVGVLGGSLMGLPLFTTQAIGLTGSPSESFIVLCDPSRIWFVDDGATFSASKATSIEMSDAPTNDSAVPTGATQVSMWQVESTAILSTSYLNWKTADNTSACVVLTKCGF